MYFSPQDLGGRAYLRSWGTAARPTKSDLDTDRLGALGAAGGPRTRPAALAWALAAPLPLSVEYVRGMVGGIGVKKLGKLDKFAATVAVLDEGMNLGQRIA
jgi:hypothetical protein